MRKITVSFISAILLAMVLIPATVRADDADKPNLKVRFLLQSQAQMTEDGNPAGDAWGTEFFLRRARIILAGNVTKWLHFFMETDNPNMGKNGDWTPKTFIQDAFVDFRLMDEFNIAAGMILLPFSHMNRQSAASLNTLDYHNLFSGKFVKDFVWRDAGVEFRGLISNMFDYRIGIFNGARGIGDITKHKDYKDKYANLAEGEVPTINNPTDAPRITGRISLNIFDPEPGFFFGGTNLGKKKVLAIGAGFDFQPGAALDDKGNNKMYAAASGDIYLDIPLNDKLELTGQAAFVWFDRGNDENVLKDTGLLDYSTASKGTGLGAYGDLGFRYDFIQPVVGFEWFDSDNDAGDTTNIRAGVNWWIKGHSTNLKLEYAYLVSGGADFDDGSSQITLQSQFLF
jgi:hypothetical protein